MKITFDFPREVMELSTEKGKGYRKIVKDTDDLEQYWAGKNGVSNAFMTVYGYRGTVQPHNKRVDLVTPIIRHFVMDFDPKNFRDRKKGKVDPDITRQQTLALHHHLLKQDISHAVWYSGGGFHVWVALDKAYTPGSGSHLSAIKEAGMTQVNDWVRDLDLFCSDPAVPFDTSGMIRIPNSYNAKRGFWSVPVATDDLENGMDHIMQIALDAKRGCISYGNEGVSLIVKKPSERGQIFNTQSKPLDLPTVKMNDVIILPCLNQAACSQGSNPSHDERVQLVKYLAKRLRNFIPLWKYGNADMEGHIETITNYIMSLQWADQNEGVTRYQVSSIVGTDYPQTCKMLWEKGLCLGKCRYWDKSGAIKEAQS